MILTLRNNIAVLGFMLTLAGWSTCGTGGGTKEDMFRMDMNRAEKTGASYQDKKNLHALYKPSEFKRNKDAQYKPWADHNRNKNFKLKQPMPKNTQNKNSKTKK
jgi:hypothetical protein